MIHLINTHKLNVLRETTRDYANPDGLRREGKVFFIGGNLPIYSTLETMYESYCQESSELFYVSFGDAGQFEQNLEMVRQIKRNFSMRLMGRIGNRLSASQVERIYLAGLDILDIPGVVYGRHTAANLDDYRAIRRKAFSTATATFKRWSVVSSISAEHEDLQEVFDSIQELLENGVIPLFEITGTDSDRNFEEIGHVFAILAAQWHRHQVPLKPIVPLLRLTTPFDFAESTGFLRGFIGKIQNRHVLATSDLRRHLLTSGAEASFESAGL